MKKVSEHASQLFFSLYKKEKKRSSLGVDDQECDYFQASGHWLMDHYEGLLNQLHWWQRIALGSIVFLGISLVCLLLVLPLKTLVPIEVDKVTDAQGQMWTFVKTIKGNITPTEGQLENELSQYVVARESYSLTTLNQLYQTVTARSSGHALLQYQQSVDPKNKHSIEHQLGQGDRRVHIWNVTILSREQKQSKHQMTNINSARVDFSMTTTAADGQEKTSNAYVILSWQYNGVPRQQEAVWQNWDGFTVTDYKVFY